LTTETRPRYVAVVQATATTDGQATVERLIPDEYIVRRTTGEAIAHLGLVEPTTIDLSKPANAAR
jgi:hypothetical protein